MSVTFVSVLARIERVCGGMPYPLLEKRSKNIPLVSLKMRKLDPNYIKQSIMTLYSAML